MHIMTELISKLATVSSSDFKKHGWRGVFERLVQSPDGALVIVRYDQPVAVILTVPEYERLMGLVVDLD